VHNSITNKDLRMQKYFDLMGISLSGICFIHCLLTPVLIMLSPFLAGHEFHENIIYLIIPTAVIALAVGCSRHRDIWVGIIGITGISILILALIYHTTYGELVGLILTMIGSILIISAHYRNRILCQKESFSCHNKSQ